MVLLLKKYKTVKEFIVTFIWFLTFTFCLGGLCYGLLSLFRIPTSVNGLLINNFSVPISLFILIISFYIYLLYKTIYIVKRKHSKHTQMYSVVIINNGKSYNLEGFLDTGNHIYSQGQPVVVISKQLFLRIFKTAYKTCYNAKSALSNAHYISVSAVQDKNKMLVFTTEQLQIHIANQTKTIPNAQLGLSKNNFNQEFDCLLHPDII